MILLSSPEDTDLFGGLTVSEESPAGSTGRAATRATASASATAGRRATGARTTQAALC